LYEKHGLRDIALEGYLKERTPIRTGWFEKAAEGLGPASKNRVVVRLLREGEISCAEFLKLVHNDVTLHPIETTTEYNVRLSDEASIAPLVYLLKIGQKSLRQKHLPKLEELTRDLHSAEKSGDGDLATKRRSEIFEYILSADSWTEAKRKALRGDDPDTQISAERHLAVVKEIASRAKKLAVQVEPQEEKAIQEHIAFFRARSESSTTMISSTGKIADQPAMSLVAMVVGAAHTEGMCALLKKASRPFAVIRHLSFDTMDVPLERKYERSSIYSAGFTKMLTEAFRSRTRKKPEPVLAEPWFQAKAELYLLVERIVRDILGPPEPPNGGKPPYGFPDDAFRKGRVFIDPNRIRIISDAEGLPGLAVLFPVILNPDDSARRTEIWAKAGLGVAPTEEQERESVESMLKRALEKTKKEKGPGDKVEDEKGRVQITLNTVVGLAKTAGGASEIVLRSI